MPTVEKRPEHMAIKLIGVGDSGCGKTGSLAALANVGYELFILDFDNGVEPLFTYVDPNRRHLVHYETLTNKLKGSGAGASIVMANAASRAFSLMNNWVDSETKQSFGGVASWGSDRVLVIDSLTFFGNSCLLAVMQREGKSDFRPQPVSGFNPMSVYGDAMDMVESSLALLFSPEVKCNVVVLSHKKYYTRKGEDDVVYPAAIGKQLAPIIPRYFNSLIRYQQAGNERYIYTTPDVNLATKSPYKLEPRYKISNGLALIFRAALGDPPKREEKL
jgi:hypothetical protein